MCEKVLIMRVFCVGQRKWIYTIGPLRSRVVISLESSHNQNIKFCIVSGTIVRCVGPGTNGCGGKKESGFCGGSAPLKN